MGDGKLRSLRCCLIIYYLLQPEICCPNGAREENEYHLAYDLSDIKVTLLCPQNCSSTFNMHSMNICKLFTCNLLFTFKMIRDDKLCE